MGEARKSRRERKMRSVIGRGDVERKTEERGREREDGTNSFNPLGEASRRLVRWAWVIVEVVG